MVNSVVATLQGHELESAIAAGVTLVDFWAPWCQPCRLQQTILEKVAGLVGDGIRVCKVDVDENADLMQRYQLNGLPTLLLFKDGNAVKRFIGVQPQEVLLKALHVYE